MRKPGLATVVRLACADADSARTKDERAAANKQRPSRAKRLKDVVFIVLNSQRRAFGKLHNYADEAFA
ncbi:MAG: hypothetical protein C0507_17380 [Cyanobacteria bacterium PR.3.49]|nr:hypothetical protein [Cyanobacteria bacterium PR.3.49]